MRSGLDIIVISRASGLATRLLATGLATRLLAIGCSRLGSPPCSRLATGLATVLLAIVLLATVLLATVLLATVLLATVLVGCGARTELDVEARDAQPPDAFYFVTFPCRWTLGRSIELSRGEGFTDLAGAVHPTRELVLVAASERVAGREATLLTLSGTPEIRSTVSGFPAGALFSGLDGFARQDGDGCAITEIDPMLAPARSLRWSESSCDVGQSRVGWVESVAVGDSAGGAAHEIGPLFEAEVAAEPIGGATERADRGEVVIDAGGARFVLSLFAGRLSVARSGPDGVSSIRLVDTTGTAVLFSSAPDRLRGGALVLFRSATAAWRLVHLPADGPLAPTDVLDLGALPAAPTGQLVTNETEALMPLIDGTLAYVPLARSHLRHLDEAVEGGPVEAVTAILRPDDSAGGLLYVTREGATAVLRYQPLTCNR